MGSSTCCTSRQPPSPDGEAVRTVAMIVLPSSPSKSKKLSKESPTKIETPTNESPSKQTNGTNNPLSSWNTAISRFSKLEDAAELRAIFEDDKSEKSDSDSEHQRVEIRKSSSTLNAVKSQLRKRLSREPAIRKQHSHSMIGSSEEEVERRAELRRIRHKRIQEELSNESAYDEDAKSLTSVGDPKTSNMNTTPSMALGGYAVFSSLSKQHEAFLATGGHKTTEMSLMGSTRSQRRLSNPGLIKPTISGAYSITTGSRRHSSPALSPIEIENLEIKDRNHKLECSSISAPMPPTPTLEPQRLPSIAEPVIRRSSWRLSFATDDRASQLRALSQGHTINSALINTSSGPQPINRWLHSQGLRSPSQALTSSEDATNPGSSGSQSQARDAADEFGGVDGISEPAGSIHLNELGVSQMLSRGLHSSSSSPQLSSWGSRTHQRGFSVISGGSRLTHNSRTRYLRNTSDSTHLSEIIPPSWGRVLQDGASSTYSSANFEISQGTDSFTVDRLSLQGVTKHKVELDGQLNSNDAPASRFLKTIPDTTTGKLSSTSLAVISAELSGMPTLDNSSTVASETESFRQREIELNMIKTRFVTSESPRKISTPISSKFKEEFDIIDSISMPMRNKTSILSGFQLPTLPQFPKLAKITSKSYDGASPGLDDVLSIPAQRVGFGYKFPTALSTPESKSSVKERLFDPKTPWMTDLGASLVDEGDEVVGVWAKAVKMHEDEAKLTKVAKKRTNTGLENITTFSWKLRKKTKIFEGKAHEEEQTFGETMPDTIREDIEHRLIAQRRKEQTERLVNSWGDELVSIEREAKAKTMGISPRGRARERPKTIAPKSWARYPSHTRSERTASAGPNDRVVINDFAINNTPTQDSETGSPKAESNHIHIHSAGKDLSSDMQKVGKRLTVKLSKKFRQSFYKLRISMLGNDDIHGRRSSVSIGGTLEYPELEVLPLEVMETQKLEAEVGEQLRMDERERRKKMAMSAFSADFAMDVFGDACRDDENEADDIDTSKVSIADPKFYDDCIVPQPSEDARFDGDAILREVVQKGKYRTWRGRDWDQIGGCSSSKGGTTSIGTMALRRSTVDFHDELERMQLVERDRAVRAAEKAWGRGFI